MGDYTRTPNMTASKLHQTARSAMKISNRSCVVIPSESDKDLPEDVFEIVNGTWHVHKVSPMWGFRYEEVHLKRYGKLMSEHLGISDEGLSNESVFTILPDLKTGPNDEDAVKIEVYSTINDMRRLIFKGILLSANRTTSQLTDQMVYLPVFLTKGLTTITKMVSAFLRHAFDCTVFPLILPAYEMQWLSAAWCRVSESTPRNKTLRMRYSLPGTSKQLSNIVIMIPLEDVKGEWKCIPTSSTSELLLEEVQAFHNSLLNHLQRGINVDMSSCTLREFTVGNISLQTDGKIKLYSAPAAHRALKMITEYCEVDVEGMMNFSYE